MLALRWFVLISVLLPLGGCSCSREEPTDTAGLTDQDPGTDTQPFYSRGLGGPGIATYPDGSQRAFERIEWYCPATPEPGAENEKRLTLVLATVDNVPEGEHFRMEPIAKLFEIAEVRFGRLKTKRIWRRYEAPEEYEICPVTIKLVDSGTEGDTPSEGGDSVEDNVESDAEGDPDGNADSGAGEENVLEARCLIDRFFSMAVQWEDSPREEIITGEDLTEMTFTEPSPPSDD